MADVAKQAGVHVTTVSMALRNHPAIPPLTRERLQKLAHQMGYARDPALSALIAYRNLSRGTTFRQPIAYVTNWETRWGWKEHAAHREFFSGASTIAVTLGYQLEHFWLGEPGLTAQRLDGILHARGIVGVILASHRREFEEPLNFNWSRYSAVKIDVSPVRQPLHVITNDQRSIMMLAMQHAQAAGYRRVGLVMPRWWDAFVGLAWSAGYLAFQQQLPARDRLPILAYTNPERSGPVEPGPSPFLVPREPLARWRKTHRPDAVLSHAPFLLPRLKELGVTVPGDLAYADICLLETDGRTAGVYNNSARVGELAVEILAGQLQHHIYGIPTVATSTIVDGTWCNGQSLPLLPGAMTG